MSTCPVCAKEDRPYALALHLMDYHDFTYTKAAAWLKDQEERKCAI